MNSLTALWDASLLLCSVAFLTVAALLLARAISTGNARRGDEARRALVPAMLQGEELARASSRLESKVAATLTLELAELVRGSDREALVRSAQSAGAARHLSRQLWSRRPQDRLLAAEVLAMFPDCEEAVTRVALDDANADVRLGAALALAHEGRGAPVGEVVRKLGIGSRENSLLVVSLMRDFVKIDPYAVEALLYDLSVPDFAKLAATDALAESGTVDHAPLVAWMAEASTEDSQLRPRILRALGRIGHPAGHEAILSGLDSEVWQVRAAAAEAAGRANLKAAVPDLTRMLADPQWWVRLRAGQALMRLGSDGRLALQRAAGGSDIVGSTAARAILAEPAPV